MTDPEVMCLFRMSRPEWGDLPDEVVETSLTFQWFAVGFAFRVLTSQIMDEFIEAGGQILRAWRRR